MIKHPLYLESPFSSPIVIPDPKENLIDPAQTLFRYNDGTIIIDEFKLEVVSYSNEIAGYIVDVSNDDQYIIEYDSVDKMHIFEYSDLPTNPISFTKNNDPKSGTIFQKLPATTHVLVAILSRDHVYPYVASNIAFSKRVKPTASGGATGSFTSTDGKTVTVENGHIISIV